VCHHLPALVVINIIENLTQVPTYYISFIFANEREVSTCVKTLHKHYPLRDNG